MTPLLLCAARGHYECVEFLLEEKAKPLAKDKFKRTALSLSVKNGNLKIASLLLQKGALYDEADSSNNTPMHYAAAYGFPECIELLMKAGCDPNLTNSWKLSPLCTAMQKNHIVCMQTLLNYPKTDINCIDDTGRSLVSLSIDSFRIDALEYMEFLIIEKKADVQKGDINGDCPLHFLIRRMIKEEIPDLDPWFKLVDILIKGGADINSKNTSTGATILHEVCQTFISVPMEKPDNSSNYNYQTQTYYNEELEKKKLEQIERIRTLIIILFEKGADFNVQNNAKATPFHLIFAQTKMYNQFNQEYFMWIVNFIISKKIDPIILDNNGMSPFHLVCKLVDNQNFKNEFKIELINLFSNNISNLDISDSNGRTPFHYIVEFINNDTIDREFLLGILKFFLNQGSDLNKKDITGKSPFYIFCSFIKFFPKPKVDNSAHDISQQGLFQQEQKSNLFGQPIQQNQSLFGQPIQQNQSLFGQPIQQNQSLFGQPIQQNQSLFGQPIQQNQSLFGQPIQQNQNSFGQPIQSHQGLFNKRSEKIIPEKQLKSMTQEGVPIMGEMSENVTEMPNFKRGRGGRNRGGRATRKRARRRNYYDYSNQYNSFGNQQPQILQGLLAYKPIRPNLNKNCITESEFKQILDLMIDKKANLNSREDDGYTPLTQLIYIGCRNFATVNFSLILEIFYYFMDLGADPYYTNKDDENCLHWVCNLCPNNDPFFKDDDLKIIIFTLLKKGVNPSKANVNFITPFFNFTQNFIKYNKCLQTFNTILMEFLNYNADFNMAEITNFNTPFYNLCNLVTKNNENIFLEAFKIMSTRGLEISKPNSDDETPFTMLLRKEIFSLLSIVVENVSKHQLTRVFQNDEGIYHKLSSSLIDKNGLDVFYKVFKIVGNEDNLLNLCDHSGFTPLLRVFQNLRKVNLGTLQQFNEEDFVVAIQKMIKCGADPFQNVYQFKNYRPEVTELTPEELEKIEIERKYPQEGGQSILHFLSTKPLKKTLRFLLETIKLDINHQDIYERTPLHIFISHNNDLHNEECSEYLRYLLNFADASIPSEKNKTPPILMAAKLHKFEFVKILINHGKVNLSVMDKYGLTALKYWIKQKNLEAVERLLELGASPNYKDLELRTSLHHAVNMSTADANATFEMEELLINYKASMNEIDKRGRTPLHYAFVKIGKPFDYQIIDPIETVSSLMGIEGSDLSVRDNWGKSPLHYAAIRGSTISGFKKIINKLNMSRIILKKIFIVFFFYLSLLYKIF